METLAMVVTCLLFLLGVVGIFLPLLPGGVLVWAGIVVHQLWMGPQSVGWQFVIIASIVTALAEVLDFAASYLGAKKLGATWKGALGSVVGAIVGLFFGLPGLFFGPIIGAVLFEYLAQGSLQTAAKAGVGAVVGTIVAQILKLGVAVGLIGSFFIAL